MDGLDRDVKVTNRMIHEMLQDEEQVIIVKHHSLRNREFYSDNKHVTNTNGVQKLAGNLKFGIRKAFGIQPKNTNQSQYVQQDENTRYNSGSPQNWNGWDYERKIPRMHPNEHTKNDRYVTNASPQVKIQEHMDALKSLFMSSFQMPGNYPSRY